LFSHFYFQTVFRFFGLDSWFSSNTAANHGDELYLMFSVNDLPYDTVYTDGDRAVSKNLLLLWTNFAKYGDPTPPDSGLAVWERVTLQGWHSQNS
jgi:carboxylesterase type B